MPVSFQSHTMTVVPVMQTHTKNNLQTWATPVFSSSSMAHATTAGQHTHSHLLCSVAVAGSAGEKDKERHMTMGVQVYSYCKGHHGFRAHATVSLLMLDCAKRMFATPLLVATTKHELHNRENRTSSRALYQGQRRQVSYGGRLWHAC